MNPEKMDRRIGKTRTAIKGAFTDLINEMGFDAITVRHLTEKANINRSTFYLHYKDKYDLLEKSEQEIMERLEELSKNVKNLTTKELHLLYTGNKPFPFIIKLAEYFQENAAFLKAILGPKGDSSFQIKIKLFIEKNMVDKILSMIDEEQIRIPLDVFTAYIVSAHFGVILHWINTGTKQSPEEIATMIFHMTTHGPLHAIGIK